MLKRILMLLKLESASKLKQALPEIQRNNVSSQKGSAEQRHQYVSLIIRFLDMLRNVLEIEERNGLLGTTLRRY
jgi:hypothetical protein